MISKTVDYDVAVDASRNQYRSWKKGKDRLLNEVWPVVTPSFQLNPGDKVFTIGSCFARNIEEHLQKLGFRIPMLDFSVPREECSGRPNGILNKYTPAAIFQEIDWAKSIFIRGRKIAETDSRAFLYECDDGMCVDTNLVGLRPGTRERFFQRRSEIYDIFKEIFSADCVVITPGLIEAWFDREKGVYIQECPVGKHFAAHASRFGFERLTYEQSHRFIQDSIDAIRDINKHAKFLITTSPVPLSRTFTDDDVILANMYSKSILRAVAGDISGSNEFVDYFPSYESVVMTKSWTVWQDDLVHVSDVFVGKIVARLVDIYCAGVEDAQKLFQQSYVHLKAGAVEKALEFARQAVEKSPESGELRKHFGKLLARNGDVKEAQAQFAKGIALEPGDPELYYQLSDALARQERLEEAIEAAHRCTEIAPNNEEFHRHVGYLLARRRKLGRAAIHLALAAGQRRLKRTKRGRLKRFLRFSLPLLQKMSRLNHSHT